MSTSKYPYEDVHKTLLEDEKYNQVLESMEEEERKQTQAFMKNFMNYWQEQVINPLLELAKNPDFQKELQNKIGEEIDSNRD